MSDEVQAVPKERKRRWGKRLLAGAILVTLAGIGWVILRQLPVTNRFYTDAHTIHEPAETALPRDILWQPVRPLAGLINTEIDDYEPRLSSDGTTLFFVRGKAGKNADIYMSRRTHEGWVEPVPLVEVNSPYDDLGPEPSADGESLYFYSDRPGGLGGYDLWVAHRGHGEWHTPLNLGPAVNSEFNDYGPALTPDGDTVYFASNRPLTQDTEGPDPNAWSATLREDLYSRDYDLYMASVTEGGITQAEPVIALNTGYNDGAPAVSSFGDFLYFASDRPGGQGAFDLYRSRRLGDKHRPPTNLGPTINTAANELDAGLSLGGYALYFSSDRLLDEPHASRSREYNLYYSTSREVFTQAEHIARPPIDWAALWSQVAPNLLWALLALLLLLALWALLRDARRHRLSLLAKCLLASFIAHLLLMILFNAWEVTTTLAREFRRRGRIQIALVSPAKANELSSQLLSRLTEIDAVAPPQILSQRQPSRTEIQTTPTMARVTVSHQPVEFSDESTASMLTIEAAPESPATPRELEHTLPADAPPVVLEMNTPTESLREQSRETEAATTPEPGNASVTPRVGLAIASRQRSKVVAQMRPSALETTDRPWDTDRVSLAITQTALDAGVSQSATLSPSQAPVRIDHLTVVEMPLATPVAQTGTRTNEPVQEVTATISATFRADLSNENLSQEPPADSFRIEPRAVPQQHQEGTFAESPAYVATDAVSASRSSEVNSPTDAVLAELPLLKVALATPEHAGMAVTNEPTSGEPIPILKNLRRNLDSERIQSPEPDVFVGLRPAPVDEGFSDNSLAVTSQVRSVDIETLSMAQASPASGDVMAATLPQSTELALPALEQSRFVPGSEPPTPVNMHTPIRLRAGLMQQVLRRPMATVTTFDVSPIVDHTMEEPGTLVHALSPEDYDVGQLEGEHTWLVSLSPESQDVDALRFDLELPRETSPPEDPYVQRTSTDRLSLVKRLGGSEETERAVADALRWLANHQSADGRWDGDGFDEGCHQCGGETTVVVDRALTGLALLSFLGAGHTHVTEGPYQNTVERGLRWLLARQRPDGDLRGEETMYTHGIVTIALSEAFGMTKDHTLADPIRRATRFIDRARNRRVGGWRYDPGQIGDTSVLGWQVMALKSASINGIAVPAGSFQAARDWLDLVSPSTESGLYAYQPHREPTPAMTAEGMFSQLLLGVRHDHPRMRASAAFLADYPPDWDSRPNTYYWYYATLALFQQQGDIWENWNETLTPQLLVHQRKDEPAAGSWDPVGEWADIGGRVYQTTLCALMLEVYYRYLPLYSRKEAITAIGSIQGSVSDALTELALPGAIIRLDLPDRQPVSVTSGPDGNYTLPTPEVPDFFALSASMEDYIPSSANVAAAMVRGNTLFLDFALTPVGDQSVAVEPIPDVHHLGDDRYDGTINSQFQKRSEGSEFAATFELQADQLGPHVHSAEVRLLAKGVQRDHKIRINGTVLETRLDDAPEDGSFGQFSASFDPAVLQGGTNTIEIIAKPSSTDIDDFEFVNVQIHLLP